MKKTIAFITALAGSLLCNSVTYASSLEESVRIAVNSNPAVKAQIKEHVAQREEEQKAFSRYLPQILVTAGIGTEYSDNNTTNVEGRDSETLKRKEAQILARQTVFNGFKMQNERAREQARLDGAEFQLLEVAEEVAIQAIEAYLAVVEANLVVKNSKQNLLKHQQIQDQIKMRVQSGADNKANISQINARLALARSNLETALNNLYDAESTYYEVVGINPPEISNFPRFSYELPVNKGEIISNALANHPSLLASLKEIDAQQKNLDAVNSDYYPEFFLESGASFNQNLDGAEGNNHDAYIMVKMEYDIFQGGFTEASDRQAQSQYERSRFQHDRQLREVRKNAEIAWNAYKSTSTRVELLKDYVSATQETQRAYEQQFRIGQRSLLDLLDSENELLRAKNQRVQAQRELSLAMFQVLRAQGNLLAELQVDKPATEKYVPPPPHKSAYEKIHG